MKVTVNTGGYVRFHIVVRDLRARIRASGVYKDEKV